MENHSIEKRAFAFALLLVFIFTTVFASSGSIFAASSAKYTKLSDFAGKKIAYTTGTTLDKFVDEIIPDTKPLYYDDISSEIQALRKGDVEGNALDSPVADLAAAQNDDLTVFPESIGKNDMAFALRKGSALTAKLSREIDALRADGTLDDLKEKWTSGDSDKMKIDWSAYSDYDAPNGTINYMHDSSSVPLSYVGDDGKAAGYEVELLLLSAKKLGYSVNIQQGVFSALLAAVSSGKADVVSGAITITEERKESVDFTSVAYAGGFSMLCRKADLGLDTSSSAKGTITKISDLDGKNIGILTGSSYDTPVDNGIKNAKKLYYNNFTDLVQEMKTGAIDAIPVDKPSGIVMASQNPELTLLPETLQDDQYAFVFRKDASLAKLRGQLNEFIGKCKTDGTLDELSKTWFTPSPENADLPDPSALPGKNGTIRIATDNANPPFEYVSDNKLVGYDIDLIIRFCQAYGYNCKIEVMNLDAIINAVQSGKYEMGVSSFSITKERQQVVDFSDAYYDGGVALLVRTSDYKGTAAATGKNFFTSAAESFEKTFIREERWKMIVSGLLITLRISLLSAVFGTAIGFGLCMARRSRRRLLSGFAAVLIRIVQGIPMLVILMLLYYVVLAGTNLNGEIVAIIGFGINFGVYVSEMMRTSIDAVDKGQWEAAQTLGFAPAGVFTKIIMPQALQHMLPIYKGELISMVKMTSVVGYIAIQDLTKVSDIIRSRTYDAFFPLIMTAIIYFFLAWGMTLLLGLVEVRIDPKKRRTSLRGVNTKVPIPQEEKAASNGAVKEDVIKVEHLKKVYPNATPLKDVSTSIARGDVVTIIGPSGTGKSTFLRCINHLEVPTDGKVTVLGEDIGAKKTNLPVLRRHMGMVFQSFNLFPHMTVIENIMLAPVCLKHMPKQEAYEKGMQLLSEVGLSLKAFNYPDQMSGGQKQRIAIARTLAMEPEIVLFDEPTSALDPTMIGEVLSVIRSLVKRGYTMMIVTHEMKFARDVSTRIFYMDQGEIYEDGSPEQIFDHPQKDRTRQFVRRLKVFHYEVTSKAFDFIDLATQVENYGLRNSIPKKVLNSIQIITEELCVQTILPQLSDQPHLELTIEYSQETEKASMMIRYGGEEKDCLKNADQLSAVMIEKSSESVAYTYEGQNIYHIEVKVQNPLKQHAESG